MSKILGSWSGMRKYLEHEMLADSLTGRVRYNCTAFVGMDGSRLFEVYIDNNLIMRFSMETAQTWFKEHGLSNKEQKWSNFWDNLGKIDINKREGYTDEEFCNALENYRNQDISNSLTSNNPIVRMFAILDRRVGKRTLEKMKTTVALQPQWLKEFYILRLREENISI